MHEENIKTLHAFLLNSNTGLLYQIEYDYFWLCNVRQFNKHENFHLVAKNDDQANLYYSPYVPKPIHVSPYFLHLHMCIIVIF